jgi:hypothetical protein
MNRKQKKIQIFVAISFFFFFSFFPAFSLYNNCVETDFPSAKPTFENLDQDYLLANQQNKLEILGPSTLTMIMEITLSEKFLFFSFQKSSHDQKTITLRC